MFIVISVILLGVIVGYIFRNISFLQKVEKSISWTIFFIAFCFGSFYRFQSVDCREPVEFWRASYCICPIDYYGKSTGFTYGVPIVFQERRQR